MQTNKTDTRTQTISSSVKKNSVLSIDTGKTFTSKKNQNNIHDSVEVSIMTDSGTTQNINIASNGVFTYTGRAKSISYKKAVTDKSVQTLSQNRIKGLTTKNQTFDSLIQKQNTQQISKTKSTIAKAGTGRMLMIIVSVICILALIIWKIIKF